MQPDEIVQFKTAIVNGGELAKSALNAVAMVAQLGDILHAGNAKASNDWKVRMLKAGLESRGLSMPDDWDSLPEEVKEARLDGAIAQLK